MADNSVFPKFSAMHIACDQGDVERIQELLDEGLDVLEPMDGDNFPLHLVCKAKRPEAVAFLLEMGAKPHVVNASGDTAVHTVASYNDITSLQTLIDANAQLDHANLLGRTPLYFAAEAGALEVATMLIENGADPQHEDKMFKFARDYTVENHDNTVALTELLKAPPPPPTEEELAEMARIKEEEEAAEKKKGKGGKKK